MIILSISWGRPSPIPCCPPKRHSPRNRRIRLMKTTVPLWICTVIFSLGMGAARAQIGSGSTSIDNSTVIISPGTVQLQFAENLFFGPNTFWIIHGTLEIWSANIWIAPTARFSGTGKIIIHDPETNPFYSGTPPGPTRIDGNDGTPINVAVELRNPNNLVLEDIPDRSEERRVGKESRSRRAST